MVIKKNLTGKNTIVKFLPSLYSEIFEKLNEAVIVCSADRKILYLNRAAKILLEIKSLSRNHPMLIDQILFEENVEKIKVVFSKITSETKKVISIENKIRAKEKSPAWGLFKFSLLEIEKKTQLVFISIKDITEFKNIENQLRDNEERYKMLSNLATEGIIIHDRGIVIDANESLLNMLDTSLQKLKGKNIIELFAATEKDKQTIYKNISSRFEKSYEVDAKLPNNTIKTFEVRARNFLHKGKNLRVAVINNISEKKKEEKISNALYKISEALHNSSNLEELYVLIHKILGELIPVQNCYIALYDELSDTISFPFFVDEEDQPPTPYRPGKGLTEYVLKTGKPLFAPPEVFKKMEDSGIVENVGEPSIDWLGVPLEVGDKAIGVLAIQSYKKEIRFGKDELTILQFVSNQIASAIERKRTETQLKESEEQIRLLLDSTAEAIYATDINGICILANQACARILGYPGVESFIGKNMHKLIHYSFPDGTDYPIEKCDVLKSISGKFMHHSDEEFFWKADGTPLEVEYWSHPILKGSEVISGVITFIDISDRKKNQKAIQRYNEELTSLNTSKDKFFSVVAHDLRSPFHGLLGLSEIIVDEFDSMDKPDIKEYIGNIHKTIKNVYKLIENLLEWSRLQSGKMSYNPTKVNLKETVENVQQVLVGISSLKGIKISNLIQNNIYIYADEKMITSVFQNLISNSIKFTNTKGEIKINATASNHFIKVSISDNGVGMDEDVISKLFSLDHSISTPGTAQEKGTGLGLILCREMIEKHDGRIWVESKKNEGSIFHFLIPRFDE